MQNLNPFKLLPDVFKSRVNQVIFGEIIAKMFTKQETERVDGFVGKANPAISDRRIKEPTPHRDAFQLQPLAVSTSGVEEKILSFKDTLNYLSELGVKESDYDSWGVVDQFTWFPGVDLDKIVHYRDYFWKISPGKPGVPTFFNGPGDRRDLPQYITIKDPCYSASLRLSKFQQTLIDLTNDGLVSIISTSGSLQNIRIKGDFSQLFNAGLPITFTDTSNANINGTAYIIASSQYDGSTNVTTCTVKPSTNTIENSSGGSVDLNTYLNILKLQEQAICFGNLSGFDLAGFDDNQVGSVIWNRQLFLDISLSTQPSLPEDSRGDLWYDTSTDTLRQSDGTTWIAISRNFSVIVQSTKGNYTYDSADCVTNCVDRNQWQLENRWVHRSLITPGDQAVQATLPIIEFLPNLELNSWTNTVRQWKYRADDSTGFTEVTTEPTLFEVVDQSNTYTIDSINSILFPATSGYLLDFFTVGKLFKITSGENAGTYSVERASFVQLGENQPRRTKVVFHRVGTSSSLITTTPTTKGNISPIATSSGDPWRGYHVHWVISGIAQIRAIGQQPINDQLAIPTTNNYVPTSNGYSIKTGLYAAQILINDVDTFNKTVTFPAPLDTYCPANQGLLRVFLQRQSTDQVLRKVVEDVFTEVGGDYVTAVTFNNTFAISNGDVILFNIGEDALSDVGRYGALIRIEEDDTLFSTPVATAIHKLFRTEQVKTAVQQYPRYDLYNVDGSSTYVAKPLFQYVESSSSSINPAVGRRIVVKGKDYQFQQNLIDPETNSLRCYRDFNLQDPLVSVWRTGINKTYTPKYVDKDKRETIKGSSKGDWELPQPIISNAQHINKVNISSAELLIHSNSIVDNQPPIPGLPGGNRSNFPIMDAVDYSYGGTIKEHNGGYDSTISAALSGTSVPDVLDFAHSQYLAIINYVINQTASELHTLLLDSSPLAISNIRSILSDRVTDVIAKDDFYTRVYGDSTSGVANWISTLPFLGAVKPVTPIVSDLRITTDANYTNSIVSVMHHDGHRSELSLPSSLPSIIGNMALRQTDVRSGIGTLGVRGTSLPITTTDFTTLFQSSTLIPGAYAIIGNQVYRCNIIASSISDLPISGLAQGTQYFNTTTRLLRRLVGTTWTTVSTQNDISDVWINLTTSISTYLGSVIFDIEQLLFSTATTIYQERFATRVDQNAQSITPNATAFTKISSKALNEFDGYDATNAFTWNYSYAVNGRLPNNTSQISPIGGSYKQIYFKLFGTPVPNLEPWTLMLYTSKPSWWDGVFKDQTTGYWNPGMWLNFVISGNYPQGYFFPDGTAIPVVTAVGQPIDPSAYNKTKKTYAWLPINTTNDNLVVGNSIFLIDQLLPPFISASYQLPSLVNTVYRAVPIGAANPIYASEVTNANIYAYTISAQYLYDVEKYNFLQQPIQYLYQMFGHSFVTINGLLVDKITGKVPSHSDTLFHGEIQNGQPLKVNGLSQWIVNYNRFNGYDIGSGAGFSNIWKNWVHELSYQYGRFIDGESLQIINRNFDIVDKDYLTRIKISDTLYSVKANSLLVDVIRTPGLSNITNNWNLRVSLNQSDATETIKYCSPKTYPYTWSNASRSYLFGTVKAAINGSAAVIQGNVLHYCVIGSTIKVVGTSIQSTIKTAVYDIQQDITIVTTVASLGNSGLSVIRLNIQMPWITGDTIFLYSSDIISDQFDELQPYALIVINDDEFNVARNYTEALNSFPIAYIDSGIGIQYVAEVVATYLPLSQSVNAVQIKIAVDKTDIREIPQGTSFNTVQDVLCVIDGLEANSELKGVFTKGLIDANTNRVQGWQLQKELFVNQLQLLSNVNFNRPERYAVIANGSILNFIGQTPSWNSGVRVSIVTQTPFNIILPDSTSVLSSAFPYFYIIRVDVNAFRLAASVSDASADYSVEVPQGITFDLQALDMAQARSSTLTLNPYSRGFTIMHNIGMLSNLTDPKSSYALRTATGARLNATQMLIFRNDLSTEISIRSGSPDLAQANLSFEGYEHVTSFVDRTETNDIFFDAFLGIQVDRLALEFDAQSNKHQLSGPNQTTAKIVDLVTLELPETNIDLDNTTIDIGDRVLFTSLNTEPGIYVYTDQGYTLQQVSNESASVYIYAGAYAKTTWLFALGRWTNSMFNLRPSVGGYIQIGDELVANMETQTERLRQAYDAFGSDTTKTTKYARALTGYDEVFNNFLVGLNLSPKTKFLFWRSMIQSKGTINSIKAFINNRRFVDARVDEYWAVKLSDYGSVFGRTEPEIKLKSSDFVAQLGVEFTDTAPVFGLEPIELTNKRWVDQPDLQGKLQSGSQMYFPARLRSLPVTLVANNFIDPAIIPVHDGMLLTYLDLVTNKTIIIPQGVGPGISYTEYSSHQIKLFAPPANITMWIVEPDAGKIQPIKIKEYDLTVAALPLWDPALGRLLPTSDVDVVFGGHLAATDGFGQLLDLTDSGTPGTIGGVQQIFDPATYSGDSIPDMVSTRSPVWGPEKIGTTWLDTSNAFYKPYHDYVRFNINERKDRWGDLSDAADIRLYQWVESDVLPESYITGVPKKILLKNISIVPGTLLWIPISPVHKEILCAVEENVGPAFSISFGQPGDVVQICVNEDQVGVTVVVNPAGNVVFTAQVTPKDTIRLTIKPIIPTDQQIKNLEYKYFTPYSSVTTVDRNLVSNTKYYFFASGGLLRARSGVGINALEALIKNPKSPYAIVSGVKYESFAQQSQYIPHNPGDTLQLTTPTRFTTIQLVNTPPVVATGNCVLQMPLDYSLKTSPIDVTTKNLHSEWQLFRRQQDSNISRNLWDKITESIVGVDLESKLNAVPSLERTLYDQINLTTTRYGLDVGQAFTDGVMALDTVIQYLLVPTNIYPGTDIQTFIASYDLTNTNSIIDFMDQIYNTFGAGHVNSIFFEVLYDALSLNAKYRSIFKTSLVSIYGIRLLEVNGDIDV